MLRHEITIPMKIQFHKELTNETLADKARWFITLTDEERLAWLDEWTDILLENNPSVFERFGKDDQARQNPIILARKSPG
jgi:hypothetical protein